MTRRRSKRELERALDEVAADGSDQPWAMFVRLGSDGQLRRDFGQGAVVDPETTSSQLVYIPSDAEVTAAIEGRLGDDHPLLTLGDRGGGGP